MSGNAQKTPYGLSLNKIARNRALDQIKQTGRNLPCSVVSVKGQFVTVSFEIQTTPPTTLPNVTIPIATSKYDWIPIQKGDTGVTVAADAYLDGISDGGGISDLTQPMNLSALQFLPCANSSWSVSDPNQRVITGPGGVLLTWPGGSINGTTSGITMTFGGKTVTLTSAGFTIDGILWETHEHPSQVPTGDQFTGPPVAP